jgi:hypothetical protein
VADGRTDIHVYHRLVSAVGTSVVITYLNGCLGICLDMLKGGFTNILGGYLMVQSNKRTHTHIVL